ncbi:hypothetical protein [Tenacibaculum jejuense]|uniref:Lipoprotein n=1 Tax=Tenacibaculum jejuense TaxID=584609 RepID=A0A238U4P0_9FLAO|nr:hypothetical protein [Tenacibaculum jejuense]SNR14163.1 protein of unknown function [Tenacibaculum jejuense]
MKKIKVLIGLLIILSCSSEDEITENELGNPGMIKSIISSSPNENDAKISYSYQDGNKLKSIAYSKESLDDGTLDYKHYFFYEDNLIVRIESSYRTENITNLNVINYFEYDNDGKLIKFTRDSNRDGIETHNYSHLSNGNISDSYKRQNMSNFQTKTLEINDAKNLVSDGFYRTYTYDDKRSPHYGIIGFDKLYFAEIHLLGVESYPEYYNNIKTITWNFNSRSFSYKYNSDLKPLSRDYEDMNYIFTTTYQYY